MRHRRPDFFTKTFFRVEIELALDERWKLALKDMLVDSVAGRKEHIFGPSGLGERVVRGFTTQMGSRGRSSK